MNTAKNLIDLAFYAAVGYGAYVLYRAFADCKAEGGGGSPLACLGKSAFGNVVQDIQSILGIGIEGRRVTISADDPRAHRPVGPYVELDIENPVQWNHDQCTALAAKDPTWYWDANLLACAKKGTGHRPEGPPPSGAIVGKPIFTGHGPALPPHRP